MHYTELTRFDETETRRDTLVRFVWLGYSIPAGILIIALACIGNGLMTVSLVESFTGPIPSSAASEAWKPLLLGWAILLSGVWFLPLPRTRRALIHVGGALAGTLLLAVLAGIS